MLNLAASKSENADSSTVDWSHVDAAVVRLASAGAGLFFVVLVAGWLLSGETSLLIQTAAPVLVGGSGAIMLALGRPLPLVQLGVGAAGLIVFVSVSESDVPGNPLVGLLIMAIVASALAHRYVVAVSTAACVALAVTGYAWHPAGTAVNDRAVMSLSLVVAFVLTAWLLQYLKSRSEATRKRLQQLLASKDSFLATVSHELRTPLTTVVGLAHELRERWNDFSASELTELTALLVDESNDIANIVEDLLVAATVDLGGIRVDRRVVDLGNTIRDSVDVAFNVEVDEPTMAPVFVLGDPLRVRQIVRNLVSNAQRYGGGHVSVAIRGDGATASVEVRDDGPPLPADQRELVFDAYHRAGAVEGKPGSVGLGLTVSRRLAQLMGGDVTYHHNGREGVFTLKMEQVSRVSVSETAEPAVP